MLVFSCADGGCLIFLYDTDKRQDKHGENHSRELDEDLWNRIDLSTTELVIQAQC